MLGIIQGTTTIRTAFASMGQSIVLEWGSSMVRFGARWAAEKASQLALEWATQAGLIQAVTAGEAGQVAAHAVGESTKTATTAANAATREGFIASETAFSIGAKISEGAVWVATESAKLVASAATFAVAIAGTIELVAKTVALGVALLTSAVVMGVMALVAPSLGSAAGIASIGILAMATALKAVAIAGAASAVASIPYIGPALAIAAASTTASVIQTLASIPIVTAMRGAVLDQDTIVAAHAKEMILPARLATPLSGMLADYRRSGMFVTPAVETVGDGQREGDVHLHLGFLDTRGADQWIRKQGRTIASVMRGRRRGYDLNLVRG